MLFFHFQKPQELLLKRASDLVEAFYRNSQPQLSASALINYAAGTSSYPLGQSLSSSTTLSRSIIQS